MLTVNLCENRDEFLPVTWSETATLIGAFGGIVGGIVMPFVLYRMREAEAERVSAKQERVAAFASMEKLLRHLDECLETKATSLRDQINAVHLEVAREYATGAELRDLKVELRADIDVGRRLSRIEEAVRQKP